MNKLLRITLIVIIGIFVRGLVAYRIWFHNPYHDTLHLDPESIFADKASDNLLIRNATLIDVVAGEAVPNSHLLIRGDTIAEVTAGDKPELMAGTEEAYDARNKYIMPGLFDVHTTSVYACTSAHW